MYFPILAFGAMVSRIVGWTRVTYDWFMVALNTIDQS